MLPARPPVALRALRLGLALALLALAAAPPASAGPLGAPGPEFMFKFNVGDSEGHAGVLYQNNRVDTCLGFDETRQSLDVDFSNGGAMVYTPFLGPDGSPTLEIPPDVAESMPPEAPHSITVGTLDVGGKSYGWGTQNAGYSNSGC
jgi:hypothetical protein